MTVEALANQPSRSHSAATSLATKRLAGRGLFRTKYEGRTLRENVGLPRPANRFVARDVAAE